MAFNAGSDEVFIGKSMGHTRPYSEKIAAEMDDEIQQILAHGYARCMEILKREQDRLQTVADFLLEHETMTAEEFESVYTRKEINRMIQQIVPSRQRKGRFIVPTAKYYCAKSRSPMSANGDRGTEIFRKMNAV